MTPARYETDRSDPGVIRIARPAVRGDRIDVHCRIGSALVTRRIWIIKGEVRVRSQGAVSARNQARRPTLRLLFARGHSPQSLGLFTYQDQRSGETSYGVLVEIVGIVDPWDVPTRFHLIRRIVSREVTSSDGTRVGEETAVGQDDTSAAVLQDQSLSHRGFVYDLDAPGSYFIRTDAVGLEHRWNMLFEQVLVIGALPPNSGWNYAQSHGLGISPPQLWRANYHAHVSAVGAPPRVVIHGTGGETS